MDTGQLIQALAQDVPVVRRHAVGWRIARGAACGALLAVAMLVAMLGIRPDLAAALRGFPLWMKWAYTLSLGAVAIRATTGLARPTGVSLRPLWPLVVPVLLLAGVGVGELARTPERDWLALWLGHSWTMCSGLVLTLSLPIFMGLLWSLRALAPARPRAAGATAGLAAGCWAATIYCLRCPEASALFVLTWYSLGILLAALLGALLGSRVLRW